MTREEAYEKLNEIFRDVFDDDTIVVRDDTTSADIEDWDSLANINLVLAVEKCFQIRFDMSEVNDMDHVGFMVDTIFKKMS